MLQTDRTLVASYCMLAQVYNIWIGPFIKRSGYLAGHAPVKGTKFI